MKTKIILWLCIVLLVYFYVVDCFFIISLWDTYMNQLFFYSTTGDCVLGFAICFKMAKEKERSFEVKIKKG